MAIIINIDVMMAKRKMSLGELSERVEITPANLSILKNGKAKAIRFSTLGSHLPRTRLPAGRHHRVPSGRPGRMTRNDQTKQTNKNFIPMKRLLTAVAALFLIAGARAQINPMEPMPADPAVRHAASSPTA